MKDNLIQIYFGREYYIFDADILSLKKEKKKKKGNVSSMWYSFQSYELYFSINIDFVSE